MVCSRLAPSGCAFNVQCNTTVFWDFCPEILRICLDEIDEAVPYFENFLDSLLEDCERHPVSLEVSK